jgi:uridine kinase
VNTVIAIAGPPGAGKTLLVEALESRLESACSIYCDDYQKITDKPIEEVAQWSTEGIQYDDFVIPQLAQDLEKLKDNVPVINPVSGVRIAPARFIIFETLFGREHGESGQLIDYLVWLDVPLDLALARKLRSFVDMFNHDDHADVCMRNLAWMHHYLQDYMAGTRKLLGMQREIIMASADLVVNGEDEVDILAQEIMQQGLLA